MAANVNLGQSVWNADDIINPGHVQGRIQREARQKYLG